MFKYDKEIIAEAIAEAKEIARSGGTWIDVEAKTGISESTLRHHGFVVSAHRKPGGPGRRRYTEAFKNKALALYESRGRKSVKVLSKELGIGESMLRYWLHQRRAVKHEPIPPGWWSEDAATARHEKPSMAEINWSYFKPRFGPLGQRLSER